MGKPTTLIEIRQAAQSIVNVVNDFSSDDDMDAVLDFIKNAAEDIVDYCTTK